MAVGVKALALRFKNVYAWGGRTPGPLITGVGATTGSRLLVDLNGSRRPATAPGLGTRAAGLTAIGNGTLTYVGATPVGVSKRTQAPERWLTMVLASALVLALALPRLAALLPSPPAIDAEFLSVAAAVRMRANEPAIVFAGLSLPDAATSYRVRVCADSCWTERVGTLQGPGEWWGRLAQLRLDPGRYEVTIYLMRPWGSLGDLSVARHGWDVVVH